MNRSLTILVADDDQTVRRTLEYHLRQAGHHLLLAHDGKTAFALAQEEKPEIVFTDLRMPGIDGLDLVSKIHSLDPRCVIIVITAFGTVETAIEAMKRGAFDFLTKPFSRTDILQVLEKAKRLQNLISENINLRSLALERYQFDKLITASPAIHKLIETAARVAQTESTILIAGESGTGKELLARAIHFSSPRSEKAFYPMNIEAIPENLVDSAIFGHRKGAFTGAFESRAGAFEEAQGGTLFLDEIGELKPDVQVKLLRVLQEREFSRLGESTTRTADARIISATNKDLEQEIKTGRFRGDLFYRLCVVPLSVPPLRNRREDIPLLLHHFLSRQGDRTDYESLSITPEAIKVLSEHEWPGNVRQLENVVERLSALSVSGVVTLADIPDEMQKSRPRLADVGMDLPADGIDLDAVEKELFRQALERCNYNQSKAARFLGITRNTLLYRMSKYGLEKTRTTR